MTEASGKRRKEPRLEDFSFSFRAPDLTPERLREIHRAAKLYAERNASDPFAYGRISLYLRRGIVDPGQVVSDSRPPSTRSDPTPAGS